MISSKPTLALLPYKMGSKSSTQLAQYCSEKLAKKVWQVNRDSPTYHPKQGRIHVNWGCGSSPSWWHPSMVVLNSFNAVACAGNKLLTFQHLKDTDVRIPEFTTSKEGAASWFSTPHTRIVARATLSGHSGAGITLHSVGEELPNVPLYVKYIPKEKEFRVHVFKGQVIDVQAKRVSSGYSGEVNKQIRNHTTGWVYCRDNIVEPSELRGMAIATCSALALDFGAVDIIYSKTKDKCWVLEVNTAPGLEGTSVAIYANALTGVLN